MRPYRQSLPALLLRARETTLCYFRPIINEFDLTEQQWRILRVLHELEESDSQNLAREAGIFSQSLSRIVSRLEGDGLIIRRQLPTDNRWVMIRLSAKGKRLFNKIGPLMEAKYQEICDQIHPDKLATLYELLSEVADLNERRPREE